jgi:copper chaperone CopZ
MTCAYAVRVALMKFNGVESAEVSLNKGLAAVKLKSGNNLRPREFWEAIRKNGNTPKTTRVVVRGEVANGTQFKVSGSNEVFTIKATPALLAQLRASAGKAVTVEGILTPGKDPRAPVPLEVETMRQ